MPKKQEKRLRPKLSRSIQSRARKIATYVSNEMKNFTDEHLTEEQTEELFSIINNSICTMMYSWEHYGKDDACTCFIDTKTLFFKGDYPELTQTFLDIAEGIDSGKITRNF